MENMLDTTTPAYEKAKKRGRRFIFFEEIGCWFTIDWRDTGQPKSTSHDTLLAMYGDQAFFYRDKNNDEHPNWDVGLPRQLSKKELKKYGLKNIQKEV